MANFFGDWCGPGQTVVDPRKTIHFFWYYYEVESDDHLQYFKFMWKPTSIKGWTDPAVKSVFVDKGNFFYDLAPNSFTLDSAWSWRVEAWLIDKDYDPSNIPAVDPPSGLPFMGSENSMVLDTSGFVLWRESNSTVASGASDARILTQTTGVSSDPGLYDIRVRVSNGFQWSPYSTIAPLTQYDSRLSVKKSGIWQVIPMWKKTSGTFKEIIP